jgi:microcystin-dependent protein
MSFTNEDHMGWMRCDGRGLDKVQYNLLFQVIGYTFGGSGNTFNLPDMRGRVIGSVGTIVEACDTTTFAPGTVTGEVKHKLTLEELPKHNHDDNTPPVGNPALEGNTSTATTGITTNATGPTTSGGNGYGLIYQDGTSTMNAAVNDGSEPNLFTTSIALSLTDPGHKHKIASNGGDACHNVMQPSIFYQNTFIYSALCMNGKFPFTTGLSPVLI